MPYALVIAGLLLIITGINNTYAQFGAQLKSDFTGDKNFIMYIAALGGVGALGYINSLRTFSHYFMALILISLVLSNKGFFNNLSTALNTSPVAPTAAPATAATSQAPVALPKTGSTSVDNAITGMMNGPDPKSLEGRIQSWIGNGIGKLFGFN